MPTAGSDVLRRPALDAVAAGAASGVDLLVGTNLDETTVFTPAFGEVAPAVAHLAFGERADDAVEVHRRNANGETDVDGRMRFLTDVLFRIPAIRLAEAAHRHAPVYTYLLTWGSPPVGSGLGAFHGLDLPFMWDRRDAAEPLAELADRPLSAELAATMHGAWVAFVRDGVPRHAQPRLAGLRPRPSRHDAAR